MRPLVVILLAVCWTSLQAQTPTSAGQKPSLAAQVYDVPKDGLQIDGKRTKDDPPLKGAPIQQLNGAPHQVFHVKLLKGQSYVIDLASKDFDAYLILQNALGTLRAHDDDSGGGLNARIAFTAKADGIYRLVAAALDRKPGAFQLTIRVGELSEKANLAAEAATLNREGMQFYQQGKFAAATEKMRQSLDMFRKLYPASAYPDGHPDLAGALHNLGLVIRAMGQAEQALPYYDESLAIQRKLFPESRYPDGHPDLAFTLNNLGFVLQAMGQAEKALTYYEQSLAMRRKLYPKSKFPDGQPNLANSLNNLGFVLNALGHPEKALAYYEQSLAMQRNLYPAAVYPDGHPALAGTLENVGTVLGALGHAEKALPFCEQSLTMKHKLYPGSKFPDGHPDLAYGLENLGSVLKELGQTQKALACYEQSLAMMRKLFPESTYPDGHPNLAHSLNSLGFALEAMGQAEQALPCFEQSLAMMRRLFPESMYPDGHPALATSLDNLAFALQATGQAEKALPHMKHALAMRRSLGRRLIMTASEAEALAFVQAQPPTRDGYLSLTLQLPDTAAGAYDAVWGTKSAITRVLAQRHAASRVVGTVQAAQLDELKGLRRRIDQLLQNRRLPPAERDELLAAASENRDKLERDLAKALPMRQRAEELDARGPDALAKLLPDHVVLIDFVRYARFEFDRAKPGKTIGTPSYAAFVLTAPTPSPPTYLPPMIEREGRLSIKRIELGEAKTIDRAVAEWRSAIDRRVDHPASKQLHDLVWAKLAAHLPAGTKTLYFAPDGDLARVPWAALPVGKDRVLLEDYVIATVPHGPFLLEQLQFPRKYAGSQSALVLGDVTYGKGIWPPLPGTLAEMNAIALLAQGEREVVSRSDATPNRLAERLPRARFAHLATHGEFQAKAFAAEQQRAEKAMQSRRFGDEIPRVATKNPLGYVGLVLSDGEIISGLSILDLNLENLKLVTLSACETGLGEYTGAKGVENLQQAFHIAGCPNVVASLWKVNDAATAALMTKFYHEMWVGKKPPIEALREAQLTIYRNPELIPALAGERGAVRLRDAVAAKAGEPAGGRRRVADTKLWAAFVLSGVGK